MQLNVWQPIPAPMPKLESIHGEADSRPLRVVTACGPFTTTNNISYLPLQDLLQVVSKETPDVLILVCYLATCCMISC